MEDLDPGAKRGSFTKATCQVPSQIRAVVNLDPPPASKEPQVVLKANVRVTRSGPTNWQIGQTGVTTQRSCSVWRGLLWDSPRSQCVGASPATVASLA